MRKRGFPGHALACILMASAILAGAGTALAFDLDDVQQQARELASHPYRPASVAAAEGRSYDAWRDLRYRRDRALWLGEAPFPVHFYPVGSYFRHAVEVFEVVGKEVRPVVVTRGDFVKGQEGVRDDATPVPVAGLRLMFPLNRDDVLDELISFLGASYFRALGRGQQYGSSARGLAVDTVGAGPEEFPRFTRFWLVRPDPGATLATVYALLDGPRVVGAYRFDIHPGQTTRVDIHSRLFLRAPVRVLGIAPLTTMFYSGENQAPRRPDFRPEVHDADGLQLAADGEWIWRPLQRPGRPLATAFAVQRLQGFGLMQRDRRFESFQDLEAHYQRRPSIWVEPLGDWGPGRVHLLQLPAADETEDNIVAFWEPAELPRRGEAIAFAWRLSWSAEDAAAPPAGRSTQTRLGFGYRKDAPPAHAQQFHVDFAGANLSALGAEDGVTAEVSAGAGATVRGVRAEPNVELGGWRLTFDVERTDPRRAIELRAFLRRGGDALTETWSYLLPAEES